MYQATYPIQRPYPTRPPHVLEYRARRLADSLNKYAHAKGVPGRVNAAEMLALVLNRPRVCPCCNRPFTLMGAGVRFVFPIGAGRVGRCAASNVSICCMQCGSVCRV